MSLRTEDQVRDYAKLVLGFDEAEENVDQGTGQITTFNQLGFKGYSDKPDGWYLPKNMNDVAIILETKSEERDISKQIFIDELMKNIDIISSKYKKTVGILYNGKEIAIYKNKELIRVANKLQHKQYYIDLFKENYIDKNKIFTLTKRINDLLHFKFGIKNLYHRMIFTASALVVERFGGNLEAIKDNGYEPFRNKIYDTLAKSLQDHRKQNLKIDILLEVYSEIKMNIVENQDDINTFIDCIIEIAESINSDNWNGEDVMGIFFNEFNRYKKKSESGQVFTPEHITSFMYDLLEITYNDRLLDATCGYGWHCIYAMEHGASSVVGVDISHKMLKVAKEKTHFSQIEYRCCAIEDISFSDESFDVILSSLAFHYIEDYEDLINNLYKMLKPTGALIFTVEHPIFTSYGTQDWYYNEKGEILHFPVDNYYYEGKRTAMFLEEKVTKYHRTLTTYLNTLLSNSFIINQIVEPQPPENMMDIPGMADEMRRPMMLIVSAKKKM